MTKAVNGEKDVFADEKKAQDACLEGVKCFDCGCDITVEGDEIKNGSLLSYNDGQEDIFVFKCESCFQENEGIADYKECEVYTRIVGYLRPVKQYNPGKQQEYVERKEYKISEEK